MTIFMTFSFLQLISDEFEIASTQFSNQNILLFTVCRIEVITAYLLYFHPPEKDPTFSPTPFPSTRWWDEPLLKLILPTI